MSGILNSFVGSSYGTPPFAPTIGTATVTGATTATVSYTAPTNDGGSTIIRYTATSSPGGVTGILTTSASGTITVSGLTPNTTYTFTVTATNGAGTSAPSAASNSIATYYAPVNTVAPVVSGSANYGSTLSTTTGTWTGLPTPGYSYQWQRSGSNIGGATSSSYTLVQADVGFTIRCVVTATNVVGSSSANSNSTAVVTANVPSQITSVTATNAGSYLGLGSANVSFTPPNDGGSPLISYIINYTGGPRTVPYGYSTYFIDNLVLNAYYTFNVTPVNAVGNGPVSPDSNGIITSP